MTKGLAEARCDVLDAFAELETAIISFLRKHKQPICDTAPLGQKLAAVPKTPASPALAKSHKACLDATVRAFGPALDARCTLVHSAARYLDHDEPTALYVNAARTTGDYRVGLLLTADEHAKLATEACSLAALLVTPPPSPPRPSPASTAAP